MNDTSPIVSLEGITLRREGSVILDDVSWTIHRHGHWALLGANGSGKTTLLRVLTGYEWPSSGRVTVLGRAYGECDLRAMRKTIGWVSNSLARHIPAGDGGLDVVLSGIDATFGIYRTFSVDELLAARNALQRMRASHLENRRFGVYSQGEIQRVLIARALVSEPPLLVLDEPCAGLDPAARFEFLEDLAALARMSSSPALVFVTHHVDEIGPWVDGVHVMRGGRSLAQGAPKDVLTSAVLSKAFGRPCEVTFAENRYELRLD